MTDAEPSDVVALRLDALGQIAHDGPDPDCDWSIVELLVGPEPEHGVEFFVEPFTCTAPHDGECQPAAWDDGPMVCVMPLRAPAAATSATDADPWANGHTLLDVLEYELTRDAEPDCRDEDGPGVERIMAEIEVDRG